MGFLPDEMIAGFRGIYNLGMFFRLDTDPALHLWWGVSDKIASIPNLDIDGTIYTGAGVVTQIPDALEVMMNGNSAPITWELADVSAAQVADVYASAPSLVGKRVDFAIAALDELWQLIAPPVSIWVGTGDYKGHGQTSQPDITKSKTRSLFLSTVGGDSSRALPYYATWTDPDQRKISPTDAFCERVPRYYVGQVITWPRF